MHLLKGMVFVVCGVLLASCQSGSSRQANFKLTCNKMPTYETEMNWEVWGTAKKLEKCTGGTDLIQHYSLNNGVISYQGLNNIDSYFPHSGEAEFRSRLSRREGFKDNWKTVKIHEVRSNTQHVQFSTYELSSGGVPCAIFYMGHGNYMAIGSGGWNEIAHGVICGSRDMSETEFQDEFKDRVKAFSVRSKKGEIHTAGFKPLR